MVQVLTSEKAVYTLLWGSLHSSVGSLVGMLSALLGFFFVVCLFSPLPLPGSRVGNAWSRTQCERGMGTILLVLGAQDPNRR